VKCTATVLDGSAAITGDRVDDVLRTDGVKVLAASTACGAVTVTRPAGSLADAEGAQPSDPHRVSPASKTGTTRRRAATCWFMAFSSDPPTWDEPRKRGSASRMPPSNGWAVADIRGVACASRLSTATCRHSIHGRRLRPSTTLAS
jgi:hypothetical protein